jgi:hypothetical protein
MTDPNEEFLTQLAVMLVLFSALLNPLVSFALAAILLLAGAVYYRRRRLSGPAGGRVA